MPIGSADWEMAQTGMVSTENVDIILVPDDTDGRTSAKLEASNTEVGRRLAGETGKRAEDIGSINLTGRFTTQKLSKVDTSKFTMRTFASRRFRTQGTGKTIKRDTVYDMTERLQYTTKSLNDSLTALKSPAFNRDSEKLFVMLQKYMGDVKPGKKEKKNQLVRHIIQRGIDERSLRDEIFCQVKNILYFLSIFVSI